MAFSIFYALLETVISSKTKRNMLDTIRCI